SVPTTIEPPGAADGPPVVGYTGRLSDHRIDLELLETVLSERTDLRFVLRGFVDDPVAESVVARLDRDMGHVSYAGPVELGQVVDSITDYTVSWIPYRDNEFNRSCNPSKMPQILAAGRVAVVPELPWTPLYEGVSASYAAGDPAGASAALDQALEMQAASGSFERCRAAAARLTVSHVLTPRLRELGL
ncbi:MAG: hypothetical protein OES57_13590, partial [Acidimicrobiia bacterium]|nr:hypothetical protein [Acidimicrobiia bacterium]